MNAVEEADRIAARAWDRDPDSVTLWCRGQIALAAIQLTVELMQASVELLRWWEERLR